MGGGGYSWKDFSSGGESGESFGNSLKVPWWIQEQLLSLVQIIILGGHVLKISENILSKNNYSKNSKWFFSLLNEMKKNPSPIKYLVLKEFLKCCSFPQFFENFDANASLTVLKKTWIIHYGSQSLSMSDFNIGRVLLFRY